MNRWLVDASVLLAAEDPDDENHAAAVRLLEASDPLLTLDLASYETANVAIRVWGDQHAAARLRGRIAAIGDDGGIIRVEPSLLERAEHLAAEHDIAVYDAAYVAAASSSTARLVSCDIRDLVSRALAVLPADAPAGGPEDPHEVPWDDPFGAAGAHGRRARVGDSGTSDLGGLPSPTRRPVPGLRSW